MIIRWLGAFAKGGTLAESIQYEINRSATDEVAAEYIKEGLSEIRHARVGLLVASKALIKRFNGDCYSVLENGKLVKTRNPKDTGSQHIECWVNPIYKGIVVKGKISKSAFMTIRHIAGINNIPVMILKGGKLKTV